MKSPIGETGTAARWSIVLAGGDGRRLAPVTERLYGYARPKQFCRFGSDLTLVEEALRRAARFTGSPSRILLSTSRRHRTEVAEALQEWPDVARVEQPLNRDTTPGILLPLLHVLARDPSATVLVLPSDHHVSDDRAFVEAFVRPLPQLARRPSMILLAGARMAEPEPGLGWIVPGRTRDGWREVESFVEKPEHADCVSLHTRGAFANTFAFVGRGTAIGRLASEHAPAWWHALSEAWGDGPDRLDRLYEHMAASSFSRDVLAKAASSLGVVGLSNVGWSDVGTPERLAAARGVCEPVRRFRAVTQHPPRALDSAIPPTSGVPDRRTARTPVG